MKIDCIDFDFVRFKGKYEIYNEVIDFNCRSLISDIKKKTIVFVRMFFNSFRRIRSCLYNSN